MDTPGPGILQFAVPTKQPLQGPPTALPTTYYSPPTNGSDDDSQATMRVLVTAMAIVLIILLLYFIMAPRRSLSSRLARCGWVLYVRDGCGYCSRQMDILNGHYPKIVECGKDGTQVNTTCANPPFQCSQVSGFPYWANTVTKETKVGLQKQGDLEKMLR